MPGSLTTTSIWALVHGLTQDVDFYTKDLVEEQLRTYAAYGITSVSRAGDG